MVDILTVNYDGLSLCPLMILIYFALITENSNDFSKNIHEIIIIFNVRDFFFNLKTDFAD